MIYTGTILYYINTKPEDSLNLPKLVLYEQSADDDDLLVFSAATWVASNAFYSVYILEEQDFERFLGIAYVFNIQLNKLVQVKMMSKSSKFGEAARNIMQSKDSMKKVVLKPGVPQQ